MGHAGRSLALVERLIALGHHLTIFTFADALGLLTRAGYEPQPIAGLQFRQSPSGRIQTWGSLCNFERYLRRRRESIDQVRQCAIAEQPDLFITDFEPLTALVAASLGKPCVSIDNQHRFCHPLGSEFPARLRIYSRLAGAFVRRWIKRPQQCIVAVFHDCPASRHYQRVGVLLRDRVARLQPASGQHVLLYGRGGLGRRLVEVASTVDSQFVAYGCAGPPAANIVYKPTSDAGFAEDLASCRAVICSGGQQLIGEARFFGKPMLIVPIPKQHEQEINARYASQEGIGECCPLTELSGDRVRSFLDRRFAGPRPGNGVDQCLELMGIDHG